MHRNYWLIGLVLLLGITGCSTAAISPQGTPSATGDDSFASLPAPTSTTKLASSLTALFQQYLSDPGKFGVSDLEKQVLQRSITSGKISAGDYEQVFSAYEDCMTQHGITGVTWVKAPDGAYYPPAINHNVVSFSDDQWAAADTACQANLFAVQQCYITQQDNPDLLADQFQVVVACLRRNGFVDASYTPDEFQYQLLHYSGQGSFPFDPFDPVASACMASQGFVFGNGS